MKWGYVSFNGVVLFRNFVEIGLARKMKGLGSTYRYGELIIQHVFPLKKGSSPPSGRSCVREDTAASLQSVPFSAQACETIRHVSVSLISRLHGRCPIFPSSKLDKILPLSIPCHSVRLLVPEATKIKTSSWTKNAATKETRRVDVLGERRHLRGIWEQRCDVSTGRFTSAN